MKLKILLVATLLALPAFSETNTAIVNKEPNETSENFSDRGFNWLLDFRKNNHCSSAALLLSNNGTVITIKYSSKTKEPTQTKTGIAPFGHDEPICGAAGLATLSTGAAVAAAAFWVLTGT